MKSSKSHHLHYLLTLISYELPFLFLAQAALLVVLGREAFWPQIVNVMRSRWSIAVMARQYDEQ